MIFILINFTGLHLITKENCFHVGESLAHLHLTAKDYKVSLTNPRGLNWMNEVFQKMHHLLAEDEKNVISKELINLDQNFVNNLSSGIIHADLFKDNVLFHNNRVSGIIDFYYACYDLHIYDIAITMNDWCVNASLSLDEEKKDFFLDGYDSIRKLDENEKQFLPTALRLAAMRFWLSRLYDFHFRKVGVLTSIKAPEHFKKILQNYQHG